MAEGGPVQHLWDQFLFPQIFRAFRMAIHPRKMAIAFLAVAAIGLLGRALDLNRIVAADRYGRSGLESYVAGSGAGAGPAALGVRSPGEAKGLFTELYSFWSTRFHDALYDLSRMDIPGFLGHCTACLLALEWAFMNYPLWSVLFFALTLMILAVSGGAICRIVALQFAQGERPSLVQSLEFSARRFSHFFLAPLVPLMLIGVTGLFVSLLGLVGNIPWAGELLVGLGMPAVLVLGVVMAALALGSIAGFNLVFPAVAYDDSECFVAVNNSFRYLYGRPWRYGFYTLLAMVYGGITYYFIRLFSFGVLWISYRFLQAGFLHDNAKLDVLWKEPTFVDLFGQPVAVEGSSLDTLVIGRFLIHLAVLAVVLLLIAFCVSFYFTVNTLIYALLRKHVDDVPLDQVQTREEDLDQVCAPSPAGPRPPSGSPSSISDPPL
jgi:hypothetical protein